MKNEELLSALVDGELQDQELQQAIDLLSNSQTAKAQFMRYQNTSDVTHGFTLSTQQIDLTERIALQLDSEPTVSRSKQKTDKSMTWRHLLPDWFWQQTLGMTIAASIGALAVVGIMQQPGTPMMPAAPVVASVSDQNIVVATTEKQRMDETANNMPTTTRWTVGEPDVAERLNTYLIDHNEYAVASDIFSNARVIAYEVE